MVRFQPYAPVLNVSCSSVGRAGAEKSCVTGSIPVGHANLNAGIA